MADLRDVLPETRNMSALTSFHMALVVRSSRRDTDAADCKSGLVRLHEASTDIEVDGPTASKARLLRIAILPRIEGNMIAFDPSSISLRQRHAPLVSRSDSVAHSTRAVV